MSGDVDGLDSSLRAEVREKLSQARSTLMDALDRVAQSVMEIKRDVEKGVVRK